jgi:hypothetical protein
MLQKLKLFNEKNATRLPLYLCLFYFQGFISTAYCYFSVFNTSSFVGNEGREYVLRRILRRAVHFGHQKLKARQKFFSS